MKVFLSLFFCLFFGLKPFAQVNVQTGSATFSVPIFNWQDDKSRLNSVVALNYNSGSGFKVNDVASNVGQGWNLIAGGVITRMQIGEPDDQQENPGTGLYDTKKYPAGYLYSTTAPNEGCPDQLVNYPLYQQKNQIYKQHNILAEDREQDFFSFSFNGRSGLFVINKTPDPNTGFFHGEMLGDAKVIITVIPDYSMISQGIRTTISSIKITDESGLIYTFSNLGMAKVLKTNYCNENLVGVLNVPHFKSDRVYHETSFESSEIENPWVVNSWYLTDVFDPFIERWINYNYKSLDINTLTGTGVSYYSESNYSVISHLRSVAKVKELDFIQYPDGHQVQFNYATQPRIDFPGEYAISNIEVKYQDQSQLRSVSRFDLNTTYALKNRFGSPANNEQNKTARLYLKSVQKTGVDLKESDMPYVFDYYMGGTSSDAFIPPPYFYAKDIWGYYNGSECKDYGGYYIPLNRDINGLTNAMLKGVCFLRNNVTGPVLNSKGDYAKYGLLKQVIYPTGGVVNYEYEKNEGSLSGGVQTNSGGVHVSKTKTSDGGASNDCDHPIVTNYRYTTEGSTTASSLWGAEMPNNETVISNHYKPGPKKFQYKPLFNLGCYNKYQYPGIQYKEQIYALNFGQQLLQASMQILSVAGTIMQVYNIYKVLMHLTGPGSLIWDALGILLNIALTCFISQEKTTKGYIYSNSNLNDNNPLPTQFKRVEVWDGSGGGNGKTVYEYTSKDDYGIWEPTNIAKSMKQRYAYWAYGLPKRTTVYDQQGNKLREYLNDYYWDNARNQFQTGGGQYDYQYNSCKCYTLTSQSQRNPDWDDIPNNISYTTTSNADQNVDIYHISSGRVQLKKTHDRIFKPGSTQFLETITDYQYNNNNYQVRSVSTTNSDGVITKKDIKYSADLGSVDPYSYLFNSYNMLAVPISTSVSRKAPGESDYQVLGETVTQFTSASGPKPLRTLEKRFETPQAVGSVQFYQGPSATYTPEYFETQKFTYDNTGNLIGMTDEGNHKVTNIYDYNDKYVIASVINAEPRTNQYIGDNGDGPAYTSFETNKLGGWVLANGTLSYSSSAVTGNRSFVLNGSNSLEATIRKDKTYKVTFWADGSGVSVSHGILLKSEPLINGFRYYEYTTNGYSTVSVSGNATIDELRVYPESARMRTVTYDPLIGKTSECDENNRISYYEYDTQGRLRYLKDDKRNIVKMYEYNIVGKQQGCPATYSNLAISETYIKNNCDKDGVGTSVTYTIAANTYTSTVSQDEVDEMVQNDLDANGQAYANSHGSCVTMYYNRAVSQEFIKENCGVGYKGESYVYSVPASSYSSTISQADADEQAMDDLEANGQLYANGNSVGCLRDYDPIWEADDNAQMQCGNGGNGAPIGHVAVYMTDINPNSATYGQQQWKDGGESSSCTPANYFPAMQGDCIGNGNSQITIHGNTGDLVVIEATFSGNMQWTGLFNGAGGSITVSGAGQTNTTSSSLYPVPGSSSFSTTATISFYMPATTVTLTTKAILHNSSNNNSNSATIKVASVNGVTTTGNNSAYICTGNLGGNW